MHSTRNTFEIQLVSNSTDFYILCTVTTFLQVCKLRKIFQHPNNECICYVLYKCPKGFRQKLAKTRHTSSTTRKLLLFTKAGACTRQNTINSMINHSPGLAEVCKTYHVESSPLRISGNYWFTTHHIFSLFTLVGQHSFKKNEELFTL